MKKSSHIISQHNSICVAIWAAVVQARKSRQKQFHVIREPGQKRWLVIGQSGDPVSPCKSFFSIRSYRGDAGHTKACNDAHKAIDRWRAASFKKLAVPGNTRWIPRPSGDSSREFFLIMAATHNNVSVLAISINEGANLNFRSGKALRIAVQRDHRAVVIALLNAGARLRPTRYGILAPEPREWTAFLMRFAAIIKDAGLSENLPVFVELAELALEPKLRPIIQDVARNYPTLLARLL